MILYDCFIEFHKHRLCGNGSSWKVKLIRLPNVINEDANMALRVDREVRECFQTRWDTIQRDTVYPIPSYLHHAVFMISQQYFLLVIFLDRQCHFSNDCTCLSGTATAYYTTKHGRWVSVNLAIGHTMGRAQRTICADTGWCVLWDELQPLLLSSDHFLSRVVKTSNK